MGARISSIPRRMPWEEWHLGQIVQLHALLDRELGSGSVNALRASFNWNAVMAMTSHEPVPVERRHVQELAAGIARLAETWDEFSQRQPPLDDASEERKTERQRKDQQRREQMQECERQWDAMTLEEVWPIIVKASLQRKREPAAWQVIAGIVTTCVRQRGGA